MNRTIYLALALAGCDVAAPAASPTFDPLAFFTGSSRGEGTLKILAKPSVTIRVESQGRPDGKGGLILDQTIREGAKPARQRRWVLRPTSATTVTGTITDNPGPVSGRLDGNRLLLSYMMKGGLKVEQVMTTQPGGRSLTNRMTIRKFGMPVAH
ncbi:MAG: DUF3833 domain-containing protein, partial [Pseudomonadota bacterium]|nr:DUF3833 domain-containing protein [Pseudomonadota bacterium]